MLLFSSLYKLVIGIYNYSNTKVFCKDGKGSRMRVAGVVCECNPYHSGHGKLIRRARDLGAERLVAVMSGSFVQRGDPAVLSKFERAADLAEQGFSLVFELPVRYSLSSSERFAAAAVGLLDALGAVDTVIFGSECGDIGLLEEAASAADDPEVRALVSSYCGSGYSYPRALSAAVEEIRGRDTARQISSPNNILAIDYLRALRRTGSGMSAETFLREDDGLSAHSVRESILSGKDVSGRVTARTLGAVSDGDTVSFDRWDTAAMAYLRRISREDASRLPDMSGGLDSRIYRASRQAVSLQDFYGMVKTKSYTLSRIRRAVSCAVCGIFGTAPAVPPYARIMAIGEGGRELLGEISRSCRIPLSEGLSVLAGSSPEAELCAGEEQRATDIYNIIRRIPRAAGEDFSRKLFVLDR